MEVKNTVPRPPNCSNPRSSNKSTILDSPGNGAKEISTPLNSNPVSFSIDSPILEIYSKSFLTIDL